MIDTSEIIVSKEHVDPLRDQGFVIYKLGRITPVADGKREAKMLWGNVKGGSGQSAYLYIAWASAADGTGFTMVFNPALKYIAVKKTTAPIAVPVVGDFAGLWTKYVGENGNPGYTPQKGTDYFDGDDGYTPYIQGGYWYINGVNTGVQASGSNGRGISSVALTSTDGRIKTYRITFTDATTFDFVVADGEDGTGGGSSAITITQIAHGFTVVPTAIRLDGSTWVKSKADVKDNADTVGLVSEIIDADHFKYIEGGLLPGDFVDAANYWLSPDVAGEIFIQSVPELWDFYNIRQFIGTGTPEGLQVNIDIGDEILPAELHPAVTIAEESASRATIDPITQVLTIEGVEDIAFDFNDITFGISQTYVLDIKVSFAYRILYCVLQSDSTLDHVYIKVNGINVTGLSDLTITSSIVQNTATANNITAIGDKVTLVTGTTGGYPTLIRGKIVIKRI